MNFILRKWKTEDVADVARFADNEKIARYLRNAFPYPYTVQDAEQFVGNCVSNDETKKLFRAIEVDGAAVGSIGIFLGSDVYKKSAELGYWLSEDFWNKGIMSNAIRQICKESFEKYNIVRIFAEPFAHNAASRKALEKAGFSLEGIMKNGVYKNGNVFDYCMYALLRP